MFTILMILLLLFLLGVPMYPYNRTWGWGPSGLLGTVLVIILVLWLIGYSP